MARSVQELCLAVAHVAEGRSENVYLVGGSVRDLIIGEKQVDLDIVVEGDAAALAVAVAQELDGQVSGPSEFLTAAVELPQGAHVDIATARQETYPEPAKLPNIEPASIDQDLRRRDFSINAMALRLTPTGASEILDPCGGGRDLAAGVIRILHERSFWDDPTRIIRAIRFEQRFDFSLEGLTESRLREAIELRLLDRVTGPRVREEVAKLLAEPDPLRVVGRLRELTVLDQLVPATCLDETTSRWIAQMPVGQIVLRVPGTKLVRGSYLLGALCARGSPQRVAERLQLPRDNRALMEEMSRAARRPLPCVLVRRTRPVDAQLAHALDEKGLGELIIYWLRSCPVGKRRLERYVHHLRGVKADISGHDLISQGISGGPAVAVGLRAARLAKLRGHASPEAQYQAAVTAIRRWQRPEKQRRYRPTPEHTRAV